MVDETYDEQDLYCNYDSFLVGAHEIGGFFDFEEESFAPRFWAPQGLRPLPLPSAYPAPPVPRPPPCSPYKPMDPARLETTLTVLKRAFGYDQLRPGQEGAVDATLDGRDCFVLMATGAGKSLCYQLPPLVAREAGRANAMCLVLTPLISLMEDQVHALTARIRINGHTGRVDATGTVAPACFLGSAQRDSTLESRALTGEFALVYLTPEKIDAWMASGRLAALAPLLTHVAIDESHCLSEWGHDFRASSLLRTACVCPSD